ncbi:transcriptional repressor LexA [bacterium]|nr:transcriptional repressor LexA [bacterium]
MLTKKQNQLLNYLLKKIEYEGISPSYEEMCKALNLKSKSGIHRIVKSLEERGYLERLENKARAIAPKKYPNGKLYDTGIINISDKYIHKASKNQLTDINTSKTKIPLLGKIAAGSPIEAISNYGDYIELFTNIKPEDCYALSVEGDSMIDEGIYDGDIVVINKASEIKNGDIVVALIDKEQATLKKFRKKGHSIALEPGNKNYKIQIYGPDRVDVQGKLCSLIRNYH